MDSLFHKIPEIIARSASPLASFSMIEAILMISVWLLPFSIISFSKLEIFFLKFSFKDFNTSSSVALGKKK